MAYKFFQGTLNTSGTLNVENAITGNALAIDTGGITVTGGGSSFLAVTGTVVTASSKIQIGAVSVDSAGLLSGSNLVITASAISASTLSAGTLSAPNLTLSGDLIVSGNTTLGDASGGTTITIKEPTTVSGTTFTVISSSGAQLFAVSAASGTVARNMGIAVENASSVVQVALAPNGQVSGSGNFIVGGGLSVAGSSSLSAVTASSLSSSGPATIGGTLILSGASHQVTGGMNLLNGMVMAGNLIVSGTATFPNTVTIKDLFVTGTTTSVSSTNLNVADAKIVIASGSTTTASFDTLDPAGLYIGGAGNDGADAFGRISLNHNAGAWTWQVYASGAIDPALQVGAGANGSISIGSNLIATASGLFGGAITGSSTNGVGLKLRVREVNTNVLLDVHDYVVSVDTTAARTITLPSAVDVGRVYLIKDKTGNAATNNITIQRSGSDTIDGATSVKLESAYAAVSVVCVSASTWSLF